MNTQYYSTYFLWLVSLVILVMLSGCAHLSGQSEEEWWQQYLKDTKDDKLPPLGYDGGIIIIVPENSIIYTPEDQRLYVW